jgi:CRP-like cAMP-binding protein
MSVYHYETISNGDTSSINRLLARGWNPVREVSSSPDSVTVLLEKDGAIEPFQDNELCPGVTVASLTEVPVFAGLSEPELRQVLAVCKVRSAAADEVLFEPGETEQSMFVILSGEVEIALPPLPGEETVIMQIGPRDVFGEGSFWSALPHAVTARAVANVTLLRLDRARFDELLQSSLQAAVCILMNSAGILAVRLHQTDEWLEELLKQEQDARISASWRHFRESVGRSTFKAHGLFHT